MKSLAVLQRPARTVPRERYAVDRPIDQRGQYQFDLPAEFPFALKRLSCRPTDPVPPLTWHTYLELFVLLSAECRIQMGSHEIELSLGDVLVMDNLRLHAVRPSSGVETHWIVIRFLPEFVVGLTPAASDRLLLLPFYYEAEERPRLVHGGSAAAKVIYGALAPLLACWGQKDQAHYRQAGCKAYFMALLYQLARHFGTAQRFESLYSRQRLLTVRLRKLFDHIESNCLSPISLREAAAIAGLGRSRFHAVFKEATGTTLVDYLNQLRLTHAARLLMETDRSVAEIASKVGFADQSYFDRRFRRHFDRTPCNIAARQILDAMYGTNRAQIHFEYISRSSRSGGVENSGGLPLTNFLQQPTASRSDA